MCDFGLPLLISCRKAHDRGQRVASPLRRGRFGTSFRRVGATADRPRVFRCITSRARCTSGRRYHADGVRRFGAKGSETGASSGDRELALSKCIQPVNTTRAQSPDARLQSALKESEREVTVLLNAIDRLRLASDAPVASPMPTGPKVTVVGSVGQPGAVPIKDGSALTLAEALSLAGGLTPIADRRVVANRRDDKGVVEKQVFDVRQIAAGETGLTSVATTRRRHRFRSNKVGARRPWSEDERRLLCDRHGLLGGTCRQS